MINTRGKKNEALCWKCARVGISCAGCEAPPNGATTIKVKANSENKSNGDEFGIVVRECPYFIRDEYWR